MAQDEAPWIAGLGDSDGSVCIDTKLPENSWVEISQVLTLSIKRIAKKIASASPEELISNIDGLNEIIGG
jgi:hypothetical protein